MTEQTIYAYQVYDLETGEKLKWYGQYFWRGNWYECEEGFATRKEAEQDARAMRSYLQSHAPPKRAE